MSNQAPRKTCPLVTPRQRDLSAPGGRGPAAADDLAKKHGMSKFGSDRTAGSKPSYVYLGPAERKEAAGDALLGTVLDID